MNCTRCQEILSAALDGEAGADELRAARQHTATCEACSGFMAGASALHRVVRLVSAQPVPDLTAAILAATAEPAAPTRRMQSLRLGLASIALVQILLAIPTLFPAAGGAHAKHLGAIDLALAVGFAFVAARPQRALAGFLPIATVLVAVCFGLALGDALAGAGETLRIVNHTIEVAGLAVAWLMSVDERGTRRELRFAA